MIARFTGAFAVAAAVTLSLLFAMQQMIVRGKGARVSEDDAPAPVALVDVERDEPPLHEPTMQKPARPPMPAARPATLERIRAGETTTALALDVPVPTYDSKPATPPRLAAVGDSDILPIVHVAPVYPDLAVKRNIQGHVLIEFTVTADGTVRDITVLESTAPVLEATAIRAALRFEFSPRVIDGEPVETPGVQNRFVFTLSEPQPAPGPGPGPVRL